MLPKSDFNLVSAVESAFAAEDEFSVENTLAVDDAFASDGEPMVVLVKSPNTCEANNDSQKSAEVFKLFIP